LTPPVSSDSLGQVMEPGSDPARKAILVYDWLMQFQNAITQLEKSNKPVVAAIHGIAYGLAIDILSAVDIRYAEEGARFSIKEVDAGLAADIGTLQRFPKIVANDSWTRELCFTGREFSSQEALQQGFLSRVVKGGKDGVLKAAIETASLLAEKSPVALRNTKLLLLHSRDHSVQEGLEFTAAWNAAGLQSEEIPQAVSRGGDERVSPGQ
jgi:delta(3,5)-delta(2,4)-dienoyl-CoA isomerase